MGERSKKKKIKQKEKKFYTNKSFAHVHVGAGWMATQVPLLHVAFPRQNPIISVRTRVTYHPSLQIQWEKKPYLQTITLYFYFDN